MSEKRKRTGLTRESHGLTVLILGRRDVREILVQIDLSEKAECQGFESTLSVIPGVTLAA